MAISRDDLYHAALKLNDSERADLINMLLDTLDQESESGVDAAWRKETNRRVQELESGSVAPLSWKEAKAELQRGLES